MVILTLLAFTVLRPDLLVEAGIKIAISECFVKLMSALGEMIGESSAFGKFMEKLGLGFLEDIFGKIAEAAVWLINDLIEIITKYTKG